MTEPKARRRKRDAATTRAILLDTAETFFVQSGFDGTRVDAIAEVAKINKRMIYVYFGSKEGLYREVLRKNFADVGSLDYALDPTLPPDEQAAAVIRQYFFFLHRHPTFLRLLGWETLNEGRVAGHVLRDAVAAELENLHEILRRGVDQGTFRPDLDVPKSVMSIAAMCFGFFNRKSLWITLWGEGLPEPELLEAVLNHTLSLVFSGIRSQPSRLSMPQP